jgi:hypothetical protein
MGRLAGGWPAPFGLSAALSRPGLDALAGSTDPIPRLTLMKKRSPPAAKTLLAAALLSAGLAPSAIAGNLIVSRTLYAGTAATVTIGQALPGGGTAIANGAFPDVFKNETPDPSFGVTSPIYLDQLTTDGSLVGTLAVDPTRLTTSFASKSELALNVSADGKSVTFMGYVAPKNMLDVSNSNTNTALNAYPGGVYDATNPVGSTYPRAVADLNLSTGSLQITPVYAYSGNNGRAALKASGQYYMVGNAGNGSANGTGLSQLSDNTGVQRIAAGSSGATTAVGVALGTYGQSNGYQRGFSLAQVPDPANPGHNYAADKTGKDNNFRGMTVFNNTLYVSKGSGSNGVNTVYQVGAAGALANNGVLSNASITILPGFNALSEKVAEAPATLTATPHPFGLWFADADTLFVADEGDGVRIGVAGKVTTFAGLQEWKRVSGTWQKVQTFQNGLVGQSSTPSGLNWIVQQDGLRNITGQKNADGTVTVFGTTSTVSDELTHDLGADPNQIVAITVGPGSTAANTAFTVLRTAPAGQRFGGITVSSIPNVSLGGYVLNRSLNKITQQVTVTNNSTLPITGPVSVALDSLSANTALANASGHTFNNAPLGSPYLTLTTGNLAPGASVGATLQFDRPASGSISYSARAVTGTQAP